MIESDNSESRSTPTVPRALYTPEALAACERALATVVAKVGAWGSHLLLFGGLAPRYIVPEVPVELEEHVGTTDLDVVVGVALGANEPAVYTKLQQELQNAGFTENVDEDGEKQSFAWQRRVDGVKVVLEFFCPVEESGAPGRLRRNPGGQAGSRISAIQLKGAEIAGQDCRVHEIEVEILDCGGIRKVEIRVVNVLPFLVLKAFVIDTRDKPKDAYDIVWTLTAYPEGPTGAAADAVRSPIADSEVVLEGIACMREHFASLERAGPSNYSRFLLGVTADDEERDNLRRFAHGAVDSFLAEWDEGVATKAWRDPPMV